MLLYVNLPRAQDKTPIIYDSNVIEQRARLLFLNVLTPAVDVCLHSGSSVLLQVVLIVSGNLSFLNWLTIVPSLACFDDASLSFLFRSTGGARKAVMEIQREDRAGRTPKPSKGTSCVCRTVSLN